MAYIYIKYYEMKNDVKIFAYWHTYPRLDNITNAQVEHKDTRYSALY